MPTRSAFRSALVTPICLTALVACIGEDPGTAVDEANELPYAEGTPEAIAIVAVANDKSLGVVDYDDTIGLDGRAAKALVTHRDGADPASAADDDPFDTLKEVFSISYCKKTCLDRLLDYAKKTGVYGGSGDISVVFSPQPADKTHLTNVARLIDEEADETIDIAMYSYSHQDPIRGALQRAVARGVKVRFLADSDLAADASKAGGIENLGIDVRRVTKIMHHKFAIIDGPRDNATLDRAASAHVASGSGNWSGSAGTLYDENTLFFSKYPELVLRMQRDFDTLWAGSKDVVFQPFTWDQTRGDITDALIATHESADSHALFTSVNFEANGSGGWKVLGTTAVTDALAEAISQAQTSLRIASGHFVSEPISRAVIAALQAHPGMRVEIALDCQETSKGGIDGELKAEIEQLGGIIHYKCNTYRWHYKYAKQLHHKYVIIDDATLYTGSLNFSLNAETNTFENMLMFTGAAHQALIASYIANHQVVLNYGREDDLAALTALREEIETGTVVPLVWNVPIAMDLDTFQDLKDLIRSECPAVKYTTTGAGKTYNKWFNTQPQWFDTCARTGYAWPEVPEDKRVP
jgi:phosphatidylserine/phosphatidylglycerophosphate/cardiolipin synthase-like enzyme